MKWLSGKAVLVAAPWETRPEFSASSRVGRIWAAARAGPRGGGGGGRGAFAKHQRSAGSHMKTQRERVGYSSQATVKPLNMRTSAPKSAAAGRSERGRRKANMKRPPRGRGRMGG